MVVVVVVMMLLLLGGQPRRRDDVCFSPEDEASEQRSTTIVESFGTILVGLCGLSGTPMEELMGSEALRHLEEKLMQLGKGLVEAPQAIRNELGALASGVDWHEPWLQCLLLSQAALFLLTVATRKNEWVHMALLVAFFIAGRFAESINGWAMRNWPEFTRWNYFDKAGAFVSALWSGPFLLDSAFICLNALARAMRLLASLKRAQLGKERRD